MTADTATLGDVIDAVLAAKVRPVPEARQIIRGIAKRRAAAHTMKENEDAAGR